MNDGDNTPTECNAPTNNLNDHQNNISDPFLVRCRVGETHEDIPKHAHKGHNGHYEKILHQKLTWLIPSGRRKGGTLYREGDIQIMERHTSS